MNHHTFNFYLLCFTVNICVLFVKRQAVSADAGGTELWGPLHSLSTLASASTSEVVNVCLISDGHITQQPQVAMEAQKAHTIRLFTMGVR